MLIPIVIFNDDTKFELKNTFISHETYQLSILEEFPRIIGQIFSEIGQEILVFTEENNKSILDIKSITFVPKYHMDKEGEFEQRKLSMNITS